MYCIHSKELPTILHIYAHTVHVVHTYLQNHTHLCSRGNEVLPELVSPFSYPSSGRKTCQCIHPRASFSIDKAWRSAFVCSGPDCDMVQGYYCILQIDIYSYLVPENNVLVQSPSCSNYPYNVPSIFTYLHLLSSSYLSIYQTCYRSIYSDLFIYLYMLIYVHMYIYLTISSRKFRLCLQFFPLYFAYF